MSSQVTGYLLVALAGVLWGFNGLFVSALEGWGLGAAGVACARFAAATALMAPMLVWQGVRQRRNLFAVTPRQFGLCAAIGLLTNALAFSASCVATAELGVTCAAVLLYTAPVFGCVLARLLYAERMTVQKVAACALNFAGVVLVVSGGDLSSLVGGGLSPVGLVAGLANGVLYSLAAPLNKALAATACPGPSIVFWSLATAAAGSGVLCATTGTSMAALAAPAPLACAATFGLVASIVAYLLYTRGMAAGLEVSRVPVITSLEAVVSALVGFVVLHEPLGVGQIAGIAGVVGSIAVMNLHAPQGRAYGVHVLPSAEQLQAAYRTSDDLAAAVSDLKQRREKALYKL